MHIFVYYLKVYFEKWKRKDLKEFHILMWKINRISLCTGWNSGLTDSFFNERKSPGSGSRRLYPDSWLSAYRQLGIWDLSQSIISWQFVYLGKYQSEMSNCQGNYYKWVSILHCISSLLCVVVPNFTDLMFHVYVLDKDESLLDSIGSEGSLWYGSTLYANVLLKERQSKMGQEKSYLQYTYNASNSHLSAFFDYLSICVYFSMVSLYIHFVRYWSQRPWHC